MMGPVASSSTPSSAQAVDATFGEKPSEHFFVRVAIHCKPCKPLRHSGSLTRWGFKDLSATPADASRRPKAIHMEEKRASRTPASSKGARERLPGPLVRVFIHCWVEKTKLLHAWRCACKDAHLSSLAGDLRRFR